MSKNGLLLICSISVLSLASISYGAPTMLKLDMNASTDNNDANTEPGFTAFVIEDSGREVNGIIIDLSGNINSCHRLDPNSGPQNPWYPLIPDVFDIWHEYVYKDFIYAWKGGMTITLWGLGVNQQCDVTIYCYDYKSTPERKADWFNMSMEPPDYLFTTSFLGEDCQQWPCAIFWNDEVNHYAFTATTQADALGRVTLEAFRNPESPGGNGFCLCQRSGNGTEGCVYTDGICPASCAV